MDDRKGVGRASIANYIKGTLANIAEHARYNIEHRKCYFCND